MSEVLAELPRGSERIAYVRHTGAAPGLVFLGGLRSDMGGTKARFLDELARSTGRAFLRFDHFGHGRSSGRFEDGTVGRWAADAIAVLDQLTEGPQLLVGSSMGAWVMLLAALARPERVHALIGVAAAPDFTERRVWDRLSPIRRAELSREGVIHEPSLYGDPMPFARGLIEDGRRHLLLGGPVRIDRPVRLLHGMADADVPWRTSIELIEALTTPDAQLHLVKDGDHRLSRPADLALLARLVEELGG